MWRAYLKFLLCIVLCVCVCVCVRMCMCVSGCLAVCVDTQWYGMKALLFTKNSLTNKHCVCLHVHIDMKYRSGKILANVLFQNIGNNKLQMLAIQPLHCYLPSHNVCFNFLYKCHQYSLHWNLTINIQELYCFKKDEQCGGRVIWMV